MSKPNDDGADKAGAHPERDVDNAGESKPLAHPELGDLPVYPVITHIAQCDGMFGGAVVNELPQRGDLSTVAFMTKVPDMSGICLPWARAVMLDELKTDDSKLARMRRDLEISVFSEAIRRCPPDPRLTETPRTPPSQHSPSDPPLT